MPCDHARCGVCDQRTSQQCGENLVNEDNFALRPEAGPVPYDFLTESQKKVLHKIVSALREAQELTQRLESAGNSLAFFPDRVSRLFFVSGEPGSGKSTLYLTLQDVLGGKHRSHHSEPKHLLSRNLREQYKRHFVDLKGLEGSIHWLEQIDLEVAGEEGENLLAAVLVRISRALNNGQGGGKEPCRRALEQLEELANDIGIAWDGNLQARAPRLDPSSYSQEVMRVQRARLGTNQRLRDALEALSHEECYGCKPDTLFVLPIDDFYLKPAVSLELLRLLRMISIPRLFFLIMGEQKNMEALFFEKALADWTNVAGSQIFSSLDDRRKSEVLSRSREMSARYFRKLLPVSQRQTITTLTWPEALQYRPPVNTLSDISTLATLLSAVKLHAETTKDPSNFLDFLLTKGIRESYLSDPAGDRFEHNQFTSYYSALQLLEAMPREVIDLWMSFRELSLQLGECDGGDAVYGRTVLDKVLEMVLVIIEEQNFLNDSQQDLLRSAFPTGLDAWPVQTKNLQFDTLTMPYTIDIDNTMLLRKHSRWNIHIYDGQHLEEDNGHNGGQLTFSHLPPRPTAWIILLHDLIWTWDKELISENLVGRLLRCLGSRHKSPTRWRENGWAWYHLEERGAEKGGSDNWTHFPFPHLQTFRRLDRFLSVWNMLLSKLQVPSSVESLPLGTVVRHWNVAGWIATGPDAWYNEDVLSSINGEAESEKGTGYLLEGEQSLEEFEESIFEKHPQFARFSGSADS